MKANYNKPKKHRLPKYMKDALRFYFHTKKENGGNFPDNTIKFQAIESVQQAALRMHAALAILPGVIVLTWPDQSSTIHEANNWWCCKSCPSTAKQQFDELFEDIFPWTKSKNVIPPLEK